MKILFTDLDGTLLNADGMISTYTREWLIDFLNRGNVVALSSGRPLNSILEVKERFRIPDKGTYINAFNGCLIYDCSKKIIIHESPVPLGMVDILQEEARNNNLHIQTYCDKGIICEKEDEEIIFYRQRVHMPLILCDKFTDILQEPPYKLLSIDLSSRKQHADYARYIEKKYGDCISTIFSSEYYLEYFNVDGGKGNAIKRLCEYLNVCVSDTIAAGDADNDISMIEAAGIGIAMKNSSNKVKEVANIVTKYTNSEDGLIKCLNEVIG